MIKIAVYYLAVCLASLTSLSALAQSNYDPETLKVKQRFTEGALEALNEPFTGVTADGNVQPGLFSIRSSGVSTKPVVEAAQAFIQSLTAEQKVHSIWPLDSSEWRHWSNVDNGIFVRQGTSLKDMSTAQKAAAMNLMRQSLSAKGLQLSLDIMKTDQTLREINDGQLGLDEELYYFTLMGIPSSTEPWGWQVDGHHLVINYFVMRDQVVMTPVFMGGEPVITVNGKYAGNSILQDEQNLGLALMRSLGDEQRASATLSTVKDRDNNQGEANSDNLILPVEGISVRNFSAEQKAGLLELIELFVGNMREGHANVRMGEVAAHLDETWFAWVGTVEDDAVFYYRVHSPVILIEFDHQFPIGTRKINKARKPVRDHIHTVVRTPNGNDYGKDLLRQHLEQHQH